MRFTEKLYIYGSTPLAFGARHAPSLLASTDGGSRMSTEAELAQLLTERARESGIGDLESQSRHSAEAINALPRLTALGADDADLRTDNQPIR
ncbi:hypothetical protein WT05_15400 [Burkholderia stagnalis]|nr:hypothetical protein WT05_15400 [Burkholderia stagnalis]